MKAIMEKARECHEKLIIFKQLKELEAKWQEADFVNYFDMDFITYQVNEIYRYTRHSQVRKEKWKNEVQSEHTQ